VAKGYRATNEALVVFHQGGYYRINDEKEKKEEWERKSER
jgi:hypothetical protein